MEQLQTRPELTTQPGPAASRGGGLMGVAVLGSVYLSRAATHPAAAMSGTAAWLAVLSAAALPAALIMVRRRQPAAGGMLRSPSI
jgi:hypothetical protein